MLKNKRQIPNSKSILAAEIWDSIEDLIFYLFDDFKQFIR